MKKQIIICVIAIVLVIFLILSVVLVFLGNNEDKSEKKGTLDSRFFGEWIFQYKGQETHQILNSNGSWYWNNSPNIIYAGSWIVKGDQFCYTPEGNKEICVKFEFSNNDEIFTIFFEGSTTGIYIKK